MTDIIERLRGAVPTYEGVPIAWPCKVRSELLLEAAAEVERLRVENARLHARVTEYFCEPDTHPVEREE